MHELALTEDIVSAIEARLGAAHVVRVKLRIGKLAAVLPDALRFAFQVCTEATSLAGAQLEIDEVSGDEMTIQEVEVG